MINERLLIILGILVIIVLLVTLAFGMQNLTGTEANNYYYHIDDVVSGYIVPTIKIKLL